MTTKHLDINAEEIRDYAAQARYVAMAARCLENGPPADKMERCNCMLYLLEVAEDLAARAEDAADALAHTLRQAHESSPLTLTASMVNNPSPLSERSLP